MAEGGFKVGLAITCRVSLYRSIVLPLEGPVPLAQPYRWGVSMAIAASTANQATFLAPSALAIMKMAIFIANNERQESGTGKRNWRRDWGRPGILNIYANWQPGAQLRDAQFTIYICIVLYSIVQYRKLISHAAARSRPEQKSTNGHVAKRDSL